MMSAILILDSESVSLRFSTLANIGQFTSIAGPHYCPQRNGSRKSQELMQAKKLGQEEFGGVACLQHDLASPLHDVADQADVVVVNVADVHNAKKLHPRALPPLHDTPTNLTAAMHAGNPAV